MSKWLVTWYDGNRERISLVEDENATWPYGVYPAMVNESCEHINMIIAVPDNFEAGLVIDDNEDTVQIESVEP